MEINKEWIGKEITKRNVIESVKKIISEEYKLRGSVCEFVLEISGFNRTIDSHLNDALVYSSKELADDVMDEMVRITKEKKPLVKPSTASMDLQGEEFTDDELLCLSTNTLGEDSITTKQLPKEETPKSIDYKKKIKKSKPFFKRKDGKRFKLTKKGICIGVISVSVLSVISFGLIACKNSKESNKAKMSNVIPDFIPSGLENNTDIATNSTIEQAISMSDIINGISVTLTPSANPEPKTTGEVKAKDVVKDKKGTYWLNEKEKQKSETTVLNTPTIENGYQASNDNVYTSEEEVKKDENVGKTVQIGNGNEGYVTDDSGTVAYEDEETKQKIENNDDIQENVSDGLFYATDGKAFETEAERDQYQSLLDQGYKFDENGELVITYDEESTESTNENKIKNENQIQDKSYNTLSSRNKQIDTLYYLKDMLSTPVVDSYQKVLR